MPDKVNQDSLREKLEEVLARYDGVEGGCDYTTGVDALESIVREYSDSQKLDLWSKTYAFLHWHDKELCDEWEKELEVNDSVAAQTPSPDSLVDVSTSNTPLEEAVELSGNEFAMGYDDSGCFWRFYAGNRGAGSMIGNPVFHSESADPTEALREYIAARRYKLPGHEDMEERGDDSGKYENVLDDEVGE